MRSISLLAAFAVSLFVSGCGLIEDVDGPRREDFAITPANPQHDQTESPVTASDVSRGELMQLEVQEPAMVKKDGALEPDLVNVLEQAPVVAR
jgi:hypothetical protein